MSILDSSTSCIVQVLSIVQLIKADAKQRRTSFESTFDGEAPPAPPLLTEAGNPLPPPWWVDDGHHALDDDAYE